MITVHADIEQGTPEWLAAREGMFTGSNAYKLLSSFGAGEHAKSVLTDFSGNFYTKRGHMLEDEAIDLYEELNGLTVERPGYVSNDEFPACIYSPDGLTDDHLIEVKCFGNGPHMEIFKGDIPLKVLAQIHFGMMITGKTAARLIIYNPKLGATHSYKCIDIAHNPKIEERFRKILMEAVV